MKKLAQHNAEVIRLYNEGKSPTEIAEQVGRDVGNINNAISRGRKLGIVTRYVYTGRNPKNRKARIATPTQLYARHNVRTGWIWDIVMEMSDEVAEHYIDLCINDGYNNLAECFADVLIDKYFEEKSK